jgi:hypothetical protein
MNDDEKKVDPEVLEVIADETRLARGVGRESAIKRKKMQRLGTKGLQAIQARDARALTRELKLAGIEEGSDAWKRAWKIFHSS